MNQINSPFIDVNDLKSISNEQIKIAKKVKNDTKRLKIAIILDVIFSILLLAIIISIAVFYSMWKTRDGYNMPTHELSKSHMQQLIIALCVLGVIALFSIAFSTWSLVETIIITLDYPKLRWKEDHTTLIILAWVFSYVIGIGFIFWLILAIKLPKLLDKYIKEIIDFQPQAKFINHTNTQKPPKDLHFASPGDNNDSKDDIVEDINIQNIDKNKEVENLELDDQPFEDFDDEKLF